MTNLIETTPLVSKAQTELTKNKNDKVMLNSKAPFILSCALRKEEYDIIE